MIPLDPVLLDQALSSVLQRPVVEAAAVYGDDARNYWMLDKARRLTTVYVEYCANCVTRTDYGNCERRWSTVYRGVTLWLDAYWKNDDAWL